MKKNTYYNEPILIKNKNFNASIIRLYFPFKENDEDIANTEMLPRILMQMCNKYPTEELVQRAFLKNFILRASINKLIYGKSGFYVFTLILPEANVIKGEYINSAIEMFYELIYNPLIINDGFDNNTLEKEKTNTLLSVENSKKSLRGYFTQAVIQSVDTDNILSRTILTNLDQLENMTSQSLYNFYKKTICSTAPLVYVMGNNDLDKIVNALKSTFITEIKEVTFSNNINNFLLPRNTHHQEIHEYKNFKQSGLCLVYKVKNMTKEDKLLLLLIKNLLSSLSSDLLNKKLRDEGQFIYSSSVTANVNYGLLEIYTYISPSNKEIVEKKILEVMKSLEDEDIVSPMLENIKEQKRIDLEKDKDCQLFLLADFALDHLKICKTDEKDYHTIKKISPSEIINFLPRLKLDTIYFIEEDKNAK